MISLMWNLKYDTNQHIYKIKIDSQRTDLWLSREKVGGGGKDWKFEINRGKFIHSMHKKQGYTV